ncbi:MAG: 16S rRNA (guanine(527)-N(7))-methyltransferase RsmG [Rhodobacteraceae bacterium]|nr:MAG: 16S rRNA (guanine(527)-N(7))-methyltransferase RsmG [Paracoccaceae bacterium]
MTVAMDTGLNVSRETLTALESYAALLEKWNARINLVAPSTIPDLWQRHILDSSQLFDLAPVDSRLWVDLGSGGGLPGIVCAILAKEKKPLCRFTLIESDKRKAAFLMTAARELSLEVEVIAKRVEQVPALGADVVSARALAPMPQLLPLVARHLAETGVALLPKGKSHAEELAAARLEWQFEATSHDSKTNASARILTLKGLKRG